MIVELNYGSCRVIKEPGDPKFHSSNWSDAESKFLYHVLQELKKQNYDVIKKRMWKDGCMTDDTHQWIRTRSWKRYGDFCIYNSQYALFDAGLEFNEKGQIDLSVEHWENM